MIKAMLVLISLVLTVSVQADATMLSVKVVKAEASRCATTPSLRVLEEPQRWTLKTGEAFEGENDWEVYWNLETDGLPETLPQVVATCPGVKILRAIVGNADVEFEQAGDTVTFRLVRNTHRGQLMQTVLDDPEGGLPIDLHHNWEMRRAGQYATGLWPEKQIAAHLNYLFAAREALKLMGGFGITPGTNVFDGRIVLESHETAFTRGHADWPPHFHIMLYPPGYTGSQVPHFYMDDEGRVKSNSFCEIGIPNSGKEFGPGQWCTMRDLAKVVGLELMITEAGGLAMRKGPGETEWFLTGNERTGPSDAVCVSRGDELVARCAVRDDAEKGQMSVLVERYADGRRVEVFVEEFSYDRFTGRMGDRSRARVRF